MPSEDTEKNPLFSSEHRLKLHQLNIREDLADDKSESEESEWNREALPDEVPETWSLTEGLDLYDWQSECIESWFEAEGEGTAKVVTGAGKTIMALALAERLQNQREEELRVAVVVPQINLMNQWYEEILTHGNLPPEAIGRVSGEHDGSFDDDTRILLGVINSMCEKLPTLVGEAGVANQLLLIADECHNYGSPTYSKVFQTERQCSLGLSATPERRDMESGYDESDLGRELGPIVYELTLEEALEHDIIPPYRIKHYGLPLNPEEEQTYKNLSRQISDLRSDLKQQAPQGNRSGNAFFQWAQNVRNNDDDLGGAARRYFSLTSKRDELIYGLEARREAVVELIEQEFEANEDARIILFHERTDEVDDLYVHLEEKGYPAVLEHSKLAKSVREESLDLFRDGVAQIIVSAKSLIEGFDVPACDVGIIVASTSSERQRVQSLGRLLRRHEGPDGEEKTSLIHTLYAKDTLDESVYGQTDWGEMTGVDRNEYFLWEPGDEPEPQPGPPRRPDAPEDEVDLSKLESGDPYPGRYEGDELTCDSQYNIQNEKGEYNAQPRRELIENVREIKGHFGRFRVTPERDIVLVRVQTGEEWETRFVRQLDEPLEFESSDECSSDITEDEMSAWLEEAEPGEPYPLEVDDEELEMELSFTRKRGGRLARPIPDGQGEEWAKMGEQAEDETRGENAVRAVESLKKLSARGTRVSKVFVNDREHLLCRSGGQMRFVCDIEGGLEFPDD